MKPVNLSKFKRNQQILKDLMNKAGIDSFEALSQQSQLSEWQLSRLQLGLMPKMAVENLVKLANTLNISVETCLTLFYHNVTLLNSPSSPEDASLKTELSHLKQEYQNLQKQLDEQKTTLLQEFQQSSLEILESWLLQWPTAAAAAQQNPQLSAVKLLALVKPVVELLKRWGVENIGTVGDKMPYDPQYHQLLGGTAIPGDLVTVRYVGYRQAEKLLYKAKVSPINDE